MSNHKKTIRFTAKCLLLAFVYQLLYPNISLALTSGPSQPEVQSFEPVGTTDMVNTFTGDFVYNIPLLDVEGYPVNISYHAGVGMEDEASWVGLGWNINPGVINRAVRGIPDDFKGETLKKEMNIKQERVTRIGLEGGLELLGDGDPELLGLSLSGGITLNMDNYKGISTDIAFGAGVNLFNSVSAGVNLGVGSQSGADIDYSAGFHMMAPQLLGKDIAAGVSVNAASGYNTRSGIKDQNFSVGASLYAGGAGTQGTLLTGTIPVGIKNYVPVITNSSSMTSYFGRLKVGGEILWTYPWLAIKGQISTLNFSQDGSRQSYGYLYAQEGNANAIMDFTRDKDGMYNKTMPYLPVGSMAFDVYNVSGQGTGGGFRPFRNDFGTIFDPYIESSGFDESGQLELGFGVVFEIGFDGTQANTKITSGPWNAQSRPFAKTGIGNLYENTYFKKGGDMVALNQDYVNAVSGITPIDINGAASLPLKKQWSGDSRELRSDMMYYFTAAEASVSGVASCSKIVSYDTSGLQSDTTQYSRIQSGKREPHHISEIVQVQNDGKKYVYGIPAINNEQKEVSFSVDTATPPDGLISFNPNGSLDTKDNDKGRDHYYSGTITPAYAHSYLLTSVLSTDYVDVTGDGPTDDDMGVYTKFNYSLKNKDYRWRAPLDSSKAAHNPGFLSDYGDDKASYVVGSREQWMLHSIESKNFIAAFYTSARADGRGATAGIKGSASYSGAVAAGKSYKLDSIKLYNKHEYLQDANAVPVKTVYFEYSNDLCTGLPNATASTGKLTLKKISFKFGNSNKSITSPYQFEYSSFNPSYNPLNKDRWGNYKALGSGPFNNIEFPFTDQSDSDNDLYASAWNLKKITLPSGGVIEVTYEADQYAYVQNKAAMEMVKIAGVGLTPDFIPTNQLYINRQLPPCLYVYFPRRKSKEKGSDANSNYGAGEKMYFNFNINLAGKYEQIKGYASVDDVGYCNDDYGFIKLKDVKLNGDPDDESKGRKLNPITYTAINVGRYNLPHIIFPGQDPSKSDLENVLKGLKSSFNELFSFYKNPVERLVDQGVAQTINVQKSYIRLKVPGGNKKGGGHRVKTLKFYDSWDVMAGGDAQPADYGKNYDYGTGVASYEPMIGGDENPLRVPVGDYTSFWSADLYEEGPIGESLYPPGMVGYVQVTVSSIHKQTGRSSQEVDVYKFYTANDFPVYVKATPIEQLPDQPEIFRMKKQAHNLSVTQGYSVVLNDMHGKPKSTEHYVRHVKNGQEKLELVNSQKYIFNTKYGMLDNEVDVIVRDGNDLKKVKRNIGMDIDLTIDAREKKEHTATTNFNFNFNLSGIPPFFIFPIILPYPWDGDYRNEFRSAVVTKVVQQYGILTRVENFNEGALTVVNNEVFDAGSGQPIVTSVTNEFKEKEYTVTYPAYWGYSGMGHACGNIGYEETSSSTSLTTNNGNKVLPVSGSFALGDEVVVYCSECGSGVVGHVANAGGTAIVPRKPDIWNGSSTLHNLDIKVIRSGYKNQLTDWVQKFTAFSLPIDNDGKLRDTLREVINLQARTFKESNLGGITTHSDDSLSDYANGKKGTYRLGDEYTYLKNRSYATTGTRRAGLFSAMSLWRINSGWPYIAVTNPEKQWKKSRQITKWSPWGMEVENMDAVGNYSSSVYGYNEDLPVAVAYNAKQGQVLAEGFEDYDILRVPNNFMDFLYSPFKDLYKSHLTTVGNYVKLNTTSSWVSADDALVSENVAHTGRYSLLTTDPLTLSIPISNPDANKYQCFYLTGGDRTYVCSYWARPVSITGTETTYATSATGIQPVGTTVSYNRSNIIDGWQYHEFRFSVGPSSGTFDLTFPGNVYYDDIRIYPPDANMKSFVYNNVNKRLMATLDENNYATFYEYDQEGNLVRTKRETEKGIITISESRSANPKITP